MAALERTIENPVSGEQVTFLATTEETGGAFVKAKVELPPGAHGTGLHYHLAYTERFDVLEGQLDVCIGDKRRHQVLKADESAYVPIRAVHRFWNNGADPTVFTVEIRPAQHFEQALRVGFGLARDGKVNKAGMPTNIWELALMIQLAESFLPGLPKIVQKGIFGSLAQLARWKGYDPEFSQYTTA